MIGEIGLVDERQFRTLNCGEFGYRANLCGFSCGLASNAIAFHPKDCTAFWQTDVFDKELEEKRQGNAWYFQHGQALIALKYFPDKNRMKCMQSTQRQTNWIDYFPTLEGVESYMESEDRGRLFNSLSE
ncbi:MAG TPA: hypothetical protein DDZ51_29875 [Planctomycetaceae bacterium]|nr:hypothetical protein [Planctomycetaceae bacterium]